MASTPSLQGGRDWRDYVPSPPGDVNAELALTAAAAAGVAAVPVDHDFPEHSETSPMCPANSEHVSSRKGVRPYHGRREFRSEGQA